MGRLLDIFITHWTEPWSVGQSAFLMLAVQRRVNWNDIGVTIIHDGTDPFPDDYFDGYPFKVSQISIPHGGISAARNYAIDHSSATWIKFCDFDDTFAGVFSLSCIMNAISSGCSRYDMLWFPLIIDKHYGNQLVIEGSPVFIHDKVFRSSFLVRKKLRFNEELTYSEDFAFTSVLKLVLDNRKVGKIESNFPIYVYVQRMGSIVNRPDYWLKNQKGQFQAHRYVMWEMRRRGFEHEANKMVARTLAECVAIITKNGDQIDLSDYEDDAYGFYLSNSCSLKRLTDSDWDYVIAETNKQNNCSLSRQDIYDWIREYETRKENE